MYFLLAPVQASNTGEVNSLNSLNTAIGFYHKLSQKKNLNKYTCTCIKDFVFETITVQLNLEAYSNSKFSNHLKVVLVNAIKFNQYKNIYKLGISLYIP